MSQDTQELQEQVIALSAALRWHLDYQESGEIVTLDEYLSHARNALAQVD